MATKATSVRWTASDVLDASNEPIDGRFAPKRVLGEGGFGMVVEAWDLQLQQPVALKLLHRVQRQNPLLGSLDAPPLNEESTEQTSNPGSPTTSELAGDVDRSDPNWVNIERFKKEAQALAKVKTPHCVQVLGCARWWGGWYIAMEYVEGKNLHQLRADKALPEWLTLKILAGVARGLHAAHTRGIVHRDVKPENIMMPAGNLMESQQTVKITDFGIAKVLFHDEEEDRPVTELSCTGTFVGTKSYSAPEQLLCEPVDGRTDIYALGLVAYECIMGRRAFNIRSQAIVELSKYATDIDNSFEVTPQSNCSEGLANLVNEMLQKMRARRPADMREVYRRAEALLGQGNGVERGYTGSIGIALSDEQLKALSVEHAEAFLEATGETVQERPGARVEATPEVMSADVDNKVSTGAREIRPVLVGTAVVAIVLLSIVAAASVLKSHDEAEPESAGQTEVVLTQQPVENEKPAQERKPVARDQALLQGGVKAVTVSEEARQLAEARVSSMEEVEKPVRPEKTEEELSKAEKPVQKEKAEPVRSEKTEEELSKAEKPVQKEKAEPVRSEKTEEELSIEEKREQLLREKGFYDNWGM